MGENFNDLREEVSEAQALFDNNGSLHTQVNLQRTQIALLGAMVNLLLMRTEHLPVDSLEVENAEI